MANYLIVLGGGRSARYGKDKLSEHFNGRPILDILFSSIPWDLFNTVVWVGQPDRLPSNYQRHLKLKVVPGGETRFLSVKNGLEGISYTSNDKVIIHDAARFLASTMLFERVLARLDVCDVVYPAVKPSDALRYHKNEDIKTISRENIYRVQTPQGFKGTVISDIVNYQEHNVVYDEVMIAEKLGYSICKIDGEITNIKLTYPADMQDLEKLLKRFKEHMSIGFGFDSHIVEKGGTLYVGGIPVSEEFHSVGWSDGDALLHAIIDGILSAYGISEDIGSLFPPDDVHYKDISSAELLHEVISRYGSVDQIAAVVVLDKVKLSPFRFDIINRIKRLTMADKVAVTFKTTEGLYDNLYMAYATISLRGGMVYGKGN